MAETLKDFLLALALLAVIALSAMAEGVPPQDPTRPPDALQSASAAEPAASTASLRLQGLRLGQAPSALVGGRLLRVGDRLGSGTVQAIDAQGLLLKPAEGPILRLKLGADMQEPSP